MTPLVTDIVINNRSLGGAACRQRPSAMFESSITVALGDGLTARFLTDSWLLEGPIKKFAPHLFAAVSRRRRGKSVLDAITNRSWVRDIQGALTIEVLCDYVIVWEKVDGLNIHQDTSDRFIWCWTPDNMYTASSSYRAFFYGMTTLTGAKELWQARAPLKCKFFFWLLLHDRLWMAVRRKRHDLQDSDECTLCSQRARITRSPDGRLCLR